MKDYFSVILKILVVFFLSLAIFGCDEIIAGKIVRKDPLTQEEQKRYRENKEEIDKRADLILVNLAESMVKLEQQEDANKLRYQANKIRVDHLIDEKLDSFALKIMADLDLSEQEQKVRDYYWPKLKDLIPKKAAEFKENGLMAYRRLNGQAEIFNISEESMRPFGFRSGDRIKTPFGEAMVVGIFDGHLWFHIDGKKGASFSSDTKDFSLIKTAERSADEMAEERKAEMNKSPRVVLGGVLPGVLPEEKGAARESSDKSKANTLIIWVPYGYEIVGDPEWKGDDLWHFLCPKNNRSEGCDFIKMSDINPNNEIVYMNE